MTCNEIGHNIVPRKAKLATELTEVDWIVLLFLLISVFGIPLMPVWLWLRSSRTHQYEICTRCGTRF